MPGAGERDDTDPAIADTQGSDPGAPAEVREEPKRVARAVHVGDVLGRYELVEEIGEGGMATVYRARDRELRREVAIKVLFPHLSRRPEIVRRFHREARAAASLEHDNILRIYDVGGDEGEPPYIVMELIRGRTLLQEIEQRGPILAEVAACIGALLADALAAAHAAGIIHRDIKPANVLIAPGGRLLLADFGVARLETEDSLVTRTGALLGTPAYMSPEQAAGETATVRSDLYSLGATLYQLATGSLPYSGNPAKVMAMIASGALVPPLRRRPAVGPDLSRAIERLMEVDVMARPGKASVAAEELRAIAVAGGLGKPTEELAAYFDDPDGFLRIRTPSVVSALITAARSAMTESKLPRAMALADRASALAPDDPTVSALIETVTEGGRSSRRRRIVAFAALGLAVAGGGVALFALRGGPPAGIDASVAIDAARIDAAPRDTEVIAMSSVVDAEPPDASIPIDAPTNVPRGRDAGTVRKPIDAAEVAAVIADAAAQVPIDAAIAIDAALADGTLIVENDLWCEISIDGISRGNKRNEPLVVEAGHHTVVCEQPNGRWSKQVDVAAGKTVRLKGEMLPTFQVTIALGHASTILIDGVSHPNRGSVPLKAGRHQLENTYITVTAPCQIRDEPQLDCYR